MLLFKPHAARHVFCFITAMIITLARTYGVAATLGVLLHGKTPIAKTLELPWHSNQKLISCIPEGTYQLKLYPSRKFGQVYCLQGVKGRSGILMHVGNTIADTTGCILIGVGFVTGANYLTRSKEGLKAFHDYIRINRYQDERIWLDVRNSALV